MGVVSHLLPDAVFLRLTFCVGLFLAIPSKRLLPVSDSVFLIP